ncbi:WhiB family transcriptional regulator [Kineococcus rhizosphaerae]|uniref:Transcription factor WhiB n=1 Tax=Kineococcus rhizosphaerae TaxID=559628 RepID=A0A2T0QNB2_9ACTN|nr:WhiB family transcriptional regulator [Kineococcus rhizosphaerae]PRY06091.1 transcription factor WhiB [Kineococcus rhizosphaerae]
MIPEQAREEWLELAKALDEDDPPCQADPELWFSERRADRVRASFRCRDCPLLAPCRAYARSAGERAGVWGGIDFSHVPRLAGRVAS